MAWCPVCKNEYRPGITICADCGAELVEKLEDCKTTLLVYGDEAMIDRIREFLIANGLKGIEVSYDENKGMHGVYSLIKDQEKAMEYVQIFMREHLTELQKQAQEKALENATPEQITAMNQEAARQAPVKRPAVYESSQKKAEENKASAWSLMLVGGVGLSLIILSVTGIIKLPMFSRGSYLFIGVTAFLCLIFLVCGVISLKNAKGFQKNIESENSLRNNLIDWCKENLKADEIDRYIKMHDPSIDEESMYFPRNELIKARINHQFMNLDQAFLEQLVDDCIFEMVYPPEQA